MSNELKFALIASSTSVLVAIISLVIAIVSNRQSARSSKELEKLKYDFSRAASLEALNDSQLTESLKALQLAIKSIQRVKDEIQLVLSAIETPTEPQPLLAAMRSAREQMFACYEEQMATLDNDDARTVHSAKNTSLRVEALIKRSVPANTETVTLPDELREQLLALRMNLTELQQTLRDSRADKLMRRLEGARPTESIQKVKAEIAGGREAVKLSLPESLVGLRLLLVDDSKETTQLLSSLTTRHGADVRGANSAVEALDLIIRWKPQVLVSDIGMPDEDGCWLIKQVRSLETEQNKIIAIAITGGYDAKERERVLSAGFNSCLPKPVPPDELIDFIRNSLEKAKK